MISALLRHSLIEGESAEEAEEEEEDEEDGKEEDEDEDDGGKGDEEVVADVEICAKSLAVEGDISCSSLQE